MLHIIKILKVNIVFLLLVVVTVHASAQQKKNAFLHESPASFVAPKKVKLKQYVLDEVPENWKLVNGGKLSSNKQIRRAGFMGIQWNWNSGDQLEMDVSSELDKLLIKPYMKVAFQGGIGFGIWIYNEKALPEKKLTISLAANNYHKQVEFGLNYSGWRACAIQFSEMPDGGNAPEGNIQITPPKGINKGSFVFDHFEIGRLTEHTMADYQLPYSGNHNHWVNQYWWELAGKPDVAVKPSDEDILTFKKIGYNIKAKSLGWSLHVDEWITEDQRKSITNGNKDKEAKAQIEKIRLLARKRFAGLALNKKRPNITMTFSQKKTEYPNEVLWRDIEEKIFPKVALDYCIYQDEEARNRVLSMLDWFEAQGVVAGHSFGSLTHVGYRSRNLAVSLFLCRDLLAETGRLEKWIETLKWISGFAECYTKKEYNGGVGDDGTVAMARLICVLLQNDTPEKLRDAKCYFQWFNDVLGVSNGTQGVIKPDYSFYHHAMMLTVYWQTNMPQFGKVLMALEGTEHAKSNAWVNVRENLLVFNKMYRSYTQPFNLRGRHFNQRPDYRLHNMIKAMALQGNPSTGEKIDTELAATWLNKRQETMTIPEEFSSIMPADSYHQSLNWAGVSTHSIPNAFATLRGVNNNIMNWDAGDARAYSRYNRCGSMYLHSGTKSTEENGYVDKGWDWSRLPGVTAPYLDYKALKKATRHTGGYGDERAFAGGTNLNASGVYGYRISERKSKDWNGNKSWFFFGDRIVCLGSNISNKGETSLETTLFQLNLESVDEAIKINNDKITQFPFEKRVEKTDLKLVDSKGHGYYLPKGNTVELRRQEQTTGDSFNKINSGNFAVAWIDHGTNPKNADYEYMIRLNNPVDKPEYSVLQKDSIAHIVKDNKSGMVGYVVFQPASNLPGPVLECSRPGLILVSENKNKLNISFSDPDLMTNPGGRITRYNMSDTLVSPKRDVKITLSSSYKKQTGSGIIHNQSQTSRLEFFTSNAAVEIFDLEKL